MKVVNCPDCGKVFKQIKSPVCPDCQAAHDDFVYAMFEFIKDNPGISVQALAAKYRKNPDDVEHLILTGDLGPAKNNVKIQCHGCHKDIFLFEHEAHYCRDCAEANKSKSEVVKRAIEKNPIVQQQIVETLRDAKAGTQSGLHSSVRSR